MKRILEMAPYLVLTSLCVVGQTWAQGGAQVEKLKTKNNDLRGEKKIFSVANPKNLSQNLALFEAGESQFLLETESSDRHKVSSDFVQAVDGLFVKGFIDLKYGTPPAIISECPHYVTLFFRGDTEKVCSSDDRKMSKVEGLLKTVKKELKGR